MIIIREDKGYEYAGRTYPSFEVARQLREQNTEIVQLARRLGPLVDGLLKKALGVTSDAAGLQSRVELTGPWTRLELLHRLREEAARG